VVNESDLVVKLYQFALLFAYERRSSFEETTGDQKATLHLFRREDDLCAVCYFPPGYLLGIPNSLQL
jgi:hypothetical protein